MKLLFCLTFLALSFLAFASIDKLSLTDAVHALALSDEFEHTQNETIKLEYQALTGVNYSWDQRTQLLDIILQNSENKSFASKLAGLVTFQNVIVTAIVIIAVAFVVSVAHDLVLNRYFLYTTGLILSGASMFLKPGQINNPYVDYLFILDLGTALFGCLLFGVIAFFIRFDLIGDDSRHNYGRSSESNPFTGVSWVITLVWIFVTAYQQNWLVGIVAVIALFAVCGFVVGSMFGGFYTGFDGHENMVRCLVLSVLLNAIMVGFQTGAITGPIAQYATVFETGVQFWGTLVGSIAMLILTDERYIPYSLYNKKDRSKFVAYYVFMQTAMGLYCLATMYVGSILAVSSLKSIGGTFLVLLGLNVERTVLGKFKRGWLTASLFVYLITLGWVWYYSRMFPEYFIF